MSRPRKARSRSASVPGSYGLPQTLPPLPRDVLEVPGGDYQGPASLGARSDNGAPPARGLADPAPNAAAAPSLTSNQYSLWELEAQLRILKSSQVALLPDLTALRVRFDTFDVRDVTNDFRALRSEVNKLLDN
ncbi:hypothetical protein BWQ96_08979 [Gracilariopsis chorda]|uniref:Uncharacterized protein n=1 Tax=Gracilariopsis chorda TaxID=448386 RepID=A0A2V3IGT9_9FLOR|nr:hypothetical protein BWQ96_08979 [Gracilariopsis chorda]|eukprot:PXF41304.1 hypothetical protein BWQ96_08979 [Gracilariopsis chorda]